MARTRGSFNFTQNFEVFRAAPLDARQKVQSYADLVDPAAWIDTDGFAWLYNGAMVVVVDDPSSGVYWLKDAGNYTNYSNWISVGGGVSPVDPSALQEIYDYIDASLATRDSSITELYTLIDIIDSSISYITNWIEIQDVSINYLTNWNVIQDSSISALDSSIINLYSLIGDTSVKGVINVGDGSANVYVDLDSSGNIQLRTFAGSGGATVEQVGEQIIIGIDASYSGESNYGQNIGTGDASIYSGKVGDALQFRELYAGSNVSLDVSGNLVVIGATGGSGGDGIDGGVWITNITPTSGGNVGDKSYSSDGNVLDSCLTDTSALTVAVLALPGHTNYKPIVTINSNPVTLSANPDKPLWTGTYPMTYNFADASITVVHEDGASWSTTVDADTPAVISSATFINGYPGSQTELKAGDTFDVSIMTDVAITSVIVDNYGAATGGTYSVSGTNVGFTITIADRGTSVQNLGLRLRVVKSTGSTSANYLTSSQGSVDGRDLVKLNNLYPSVSFGTITYPAGQSAIKSSESASVINTVSNYDSLTYSSPNGELTVTSPTTYQTPKTVTYLAGTYNISSNNLRIVANRSTNDATTTQNTVVWIANTPATLSVSNPASRLRSGGNDGTSAQSHTITISSSQRLTGAPTLTKDTGGTWLGGAFSWTSTATSFTRSLQVTDSMAKATYNWGAISGTNLAGIVTSTNSGTTTYTLGGFVQRTITVAAFGINADINVEVSDYTKLSSTGSGQNLAWSVKALPTRSTLGDTTGGQAGKWSASATFANPTTINILDTAAASSSSQASSFTIQEGI